MSGAQEPLPLWVDNLKSRVATMPEYKALSGVLYNEVRRSMRADGMLSFGELGQQERQVLVTRARVALDKTDAFKGFKDAAWRAVDEALDVAAEDAISHRTATAGAAKAAEDTGGKVGTIVELAASSAASLLRRWPSQSHEHMWLLNALIPPPLRRALWSLKLRAPAARADYDRRRSESVLATVSLRDGAVLQQSQVVMQRLASPLLPKLPLLKACVSFADSLTPLLKPSTCWVAVDAGDGPASTMEEPFVRLRAARTPRSVACPTRSAAVERRGDATCRPRPTLRW